MKLRVITLLRLAVCFSALSLLLCIVGLFVGIGAQHRTERLIGGMAFPLSNPQPGPGAISVVESDTAALSGMAAEQPTPATREESGRKATPTADHSKGNSVFICLGPDAYAYHTYRDCPLLNQCTGRIETITEVEAGESGRPLCRGCAARGTK